MHWRQRVTPVHTTSYLQAGPAEGPALVFVHGWPGLAVTWRHQIEHFSSRGYQVIAPDMRGYGSSTIHEEPSAYRQELVVLDLIGLLDGVGLQQAIWVGHDWGSPTVWNVAAHFPERCAGAATLAVAFGTLERGFPGLLSRVDRTRYPADSDPFGQFDYMAFYETDPDRVTAVFDANPGNTVKALFRRGDPGARTHRAPTSTVTRDGGWFGGADEAPDLPLDRAVLDDDDYAALTSALQRNGFHGPTCYYLNHENNARYAAAALDDGKLSVPVLFIGAEYDQVADIHVASGHVAMRESCTDLTEATIPAGHWLQLERADEVNVLIESWLDSKGLGASGRLPGGEPRRPVPRS